MLERRHEKTQRNRLNETIVLSILNMFKLMDKKILKIVRPDFLSQRRMYIKDYLAENHHVAVFHTTQGSLCLKGAQVLVALESQFIIFRMYVMGSF